MFFENYLPLLFLSGSFLCSVLFTWLSIVYAKKRELIDLPGQRRSHNEATVRGGGVGLVVSSLIFFCSVLFFSYPVLGIASAFSLLSVAFIGWIDDHQPLSVWIRLFIHILAALILILLPLSLANILGSPLLVSIPDTSEWVVI